MPPFHPNIFRIKFGSVRFRLAGGDASALLNIENMNDVDTYLVLNADLANGSISFESLPGVGGGSVTLKDFSSLPEPSVWTLGSLSMLAFTFWHGRKFWKCKKSPTVS